MFAVHLTKLQLNNVFQFAFVCVFSTYEEKEWGYQIGLKNTPQINVSFKLMSVGHRHLLNKYWSGDAYLRKYGIYWYKNALIFYMEYSHTI